MPPSSSVQILPHPTKRRALHTTASFQPGTPILPFTPLILLPNLSHLTTACTHCLKPGTPRACTRCSAAYYCDAACQAAAWKRVHRRECKVLAGLERPLPTPARAVLLALLVEDIGEGVRALEGNVEAWRGRPEWKDMEMMAMAVCHFAGLGGGEREIQRALALLCKIQTNAFHRYDVDFGEVGIFLEPTLAMANHSCTPNAMVQFVGNKAVLRAEAPIAAGDEIEISYTDYTYPRSRRREALAPYNFTCQCPRCKNDLNVYQVCATSPNINLNSNGLVPDPSKLRHHPAAVESTTTALASQLGERLAGLIDSIDTSGTMDDRRRGLQAHYQQSLPLVAKGLWAVAPLPQILTEISILYAEEGNFVYALAIACHVATLCDPYRYVAPFHPVRIKGLLTIAKLLANTAADTAELSKSVRAMASRGNLSETALDTLQQIDQVSLCEMVLIMILKSAPESIVSQWEVSISAREMLDDINQLPGREQELSLINAWKQNPEDGQSRAFFEYAVLKQVDALASLGREVLRSDFER